jgi:large subunit ribosomal protein L4
VANLPWVDTLPSVGLNVYSILQRDHLVITTNAVEAVMRRMRRPIKPCSISV